MLAYLLRRLLLLPVILLGVTLLIFAMLSRLSVGQRAALYVRQVPRTADGMQRIIERYGLDDPLPLQYGRWLGQVARGNLGFSLTGKEPVAEVIRHHLPGALELLLWSLPLIWLGVSLGRLAAVRRDGALDQVLRLLSILAASTPPADSPTTHYRGATSSCPAIASRNDRPFTLTLTRVPKCCLAASDPIK